MGPRGQGGCLVVEGGQGGRVPIGTKVEGDISEIPWGHKGHLLGPLMKYKANVCLHIYIYIFDVHFLAGGRTHGQTSVR